MVASMDDVTAKALAEVWTTDIIVSCVVLSEGRNVAVFDDPIEECDLDTARARIAACAPEALRLLLEAEFTDLDTEDGPDQDCRWCGLPKGDHAPSCRWLLLMHKAGLR